jgi:hypothetical protein
MSVRPWSTASRACRRDTDTWSITTRLPSARPMTTEATSIGYSRTWPSGVVTRSVPKSMVTSTAPAQGPA